MDRNILLQGFERVTLAPGAKKTVTVAIDVAKQLRLLNRKLRSFTYLPSREGSLPSFLAGR